MTTVILHPNKAVRHRVPPRLFGSTASPSERHLKRCHLDVETVQTVTRTTGNSELKSGSYQSREGWHTLAMLAPITQDKSIAKAQ